MPNQRNDERRHHIPEMLFQVQNWLSGYRIVRPVNSIYVVRVSGQTEPDR